jgi:hypothetical protein
MSDFDLAVSIALGVGLAAATGFRVFFADAHCERGSIYRASPFGR